MQTFLPYEDFQKSAKVLDSKRLNKQIVEGVQIINAILKKRAGIKSGWQHHPCTLMWENHVEALVEYVEVCGIEWEYRKGRVLFSDFKFKTVESALVVSPGFYTDELSQAPLHKSLEYLTTLEFRTPPPPFSIPLTSFISMFSFLESRGLATLPEWLGDPILHETHKSNLLRKDFNHYSKFFPNIPNHLPYYWPI